MGSRVAAAATVDAARRNSGQFHDGEDEKLACC